MRIFGFSLTSILMLLFVYWLGSRFPNKIPILNRI